MENLEKWRYSYHNYNICVRICIIQHYIFIYQDEFSDSWMYKDSWGCCSRVDALVGCFCRKHSPASANPWLETRTGHMERGLRHCQRIWNRLQSLSITIWSMFDCNSLTGKHRFCWIIWSCCLPRHTAVLHCKKYVDYFVCCHFPILLECEVSIPIDLTSRCTAFGKLLQTQF